MNDRWSRGDKIAVAGILLTVIGVFAAIIVIPEVRRLIGLDRRASASSQDEVLGRQLPDTPNTHAASKQPENRSSTNTSPDGQEASVAAQSDFSPMTMEEYFDAWYNKASTSLQRDALEERMRNKRVIWRGIVSGVEAGREAGVRVTVRARNNIYGTAFLDFDASQRQDLLTLVPKQEIRFTCVIRDFISSAFLKDCKLLPAT